MDRRIPRHWRAGDNFRRETEAARNRRSDRLALWALLLALVLLIVTAVSAHASTGGIGSGSDGGPAPPGTPSVAPPATATPFGARVLRVGMEGEDVKVLNGIVKSKRYATGVRVGTIFEAPTAGAVKEFQGAAGLPATGVVDAPTSTELVHSMSRAGATWYGPGFYGRPTACGKVLRQATIGIAHRSLPCGTKVALAYHGHTLVAPVIDRGPYAGGYTFDLTGATAEALGVTSSTALRFAVAHRGSDLRGL